MGGRLTKSEELALFSMAGKIARVINCNDASSLCLRGYAKNLGRDGYKLTAAGRKRVIALARKGG